MDDVLREKILASLDRPADSASDRGLSKALSRDPAAKAYAQALRADDRRLRAWPTRDRSAAQWEAAEAKILAALDAEAKIAGGERIPPGETDYSAPPAFRDDDASPMETRPAMSEPNEHDPDLENLAALTRTSLAPGAVPSVRPHAVASIVDDADDTSSGIVDIKQLSAIARDAAASAPPPAAAAPEPAKEAPKAEAAKPGETPKADAKPAAKKDDVMVVAKPAAVPLPDAPPPSRVGGPVWAIGGMVVMAAAFFVYNSTQSPSPTSPGAVDSNAPTATATPAAPTEPPAPAPVVVAPPPPVAQPESAPVVAAAPTPTPAAESAPAPEPAVQAPAQAHAAAAPADRAPARHERAEAPAPARAAAPAPTTPPVVAAAPAPAAPPPAAPAPTAARGGAATPAAAAPASARPAAGGGSLDDIMNRVAPNTTAAAAPAAAAAPDLPERLTRSQIMGVLSPLSGPVRSCAGGETGTAPVAIVIGNDGAVRSATVSGQFAGSPVGSCIEGVVRRAHFPAFRSPTQNMMFPYVITPPR